MNDFAAKIAEVVERGRVNAEALMTDSVRVTRADPGAEAGWDEDGNIVEPEPLLVYEGRAKFQHSDPYPSTPQGGEARWTTGVRQVHFPIGATTVQSGDMVECLESRNARLVGLKVRVRIDGDKTWTTAVRFNAVETIQQGTG